MKTAAVVVGVGARTSVGLTARHTGFLLRAGAAGMTEAPLLDLAEETITMCVAPTYDPRMVGPVRALRLAEPALAEALAPLGDAAAKLRAKIVLSLDERLARPNERGVLPAQGVVLALEQQAREVLPGVKVEACVRGSAGTGFVLADLLSELASGAVDLVLLGGTHTDYDPDVIAELDGAGRLYKPGNLDAMIPGEAAAFVALMRPDVARSYGFAARAQIHAVGTAFEKARRDNDESAFAAIGLTVAVRRAGADLEAENVRAGWILTDVTFEMWRIYEWQSVMVRTQSLWCDPQLFDAPAHRLGHMGAAALPLEMALAATAWRHGYAPHPVAMAIAGSDAGERCAVLLSSPSS